MPTTEQVVKALGIEGGKIIHTWTETEHVLSQDSMNLWLTYDHVIGYNLYTKKFSNYTDVHSNSDDICDLVAMYLGIAITKDHTWFSEHDELMFHLEWQQ